MHTYVTYIHTYTHTYIHTYIRRASPLLVPSRSCGVGSFDRRLAPETPCSLAVDCSYASMSANVRMIKKRKVVCRHKRIRPQDAGTRARARTGTPCSPIDVMRIPKSVAPCTRTAAPITHTKHPRRLSEFATRCGPGPRSRLAQHSSNI